MAARTSKLKTFTWRNGKGSTYFLTCRSKTEAACIEGCGDPGQLWDLQEATAPGYEGSVRLATERPGIVVEERRNSGIWNDGATIYRGEAVIGRTDGSGVLTLVEQGVTHVAPDPVAPAAVGGRSALRHVRLGLGLDEALGREVERTGAPASEVIRRALRVYLS